jgi:hypothetical protein
MSFSSPRFLVAASLAAVVGLALSPPAQAQAPPIKPGLWEVKQVGGDTQGSARMAAELDKLSPQQRAQIEAMMKERGASFSAAGFDVRICLSKDSLDPARWDHQSNCKTDYSTRTSAAWKFHSVCPTSQTDGEVVFTSPESYTVNASTTMQQGSDTKARRMSMQAKWLSASCGDIKPFKSKN